MIDIKSTIGNHIKSIRGTLNLSQEDLAGICGFSQQYISGLERGRRNPTVETLQLIAKALDTPIEVFVCDPGSTPPPNYPE